MEEQTVTDFVNSLYYVCIYFCSTAKSRSGYITVMDSPQNDSIEVGPGSLKMSFSSTTGQLERMFNSKTGVSCFNFL